MSTTYHEQIQSAVTHYSKHTKYFWNVIKSEVYAFLDSETTPSNVSTKANLASLTSALCEPLFAERFIKELYNHKTSKHSIYFFQPGSIQTEQYCSALPTFFYKKCKKFSNAIRDMSLLQAPTIVWGGNYAAIICLADDTENVEVYLWDLACCQDE